MATTNTMPDTRQEFSQPESGLLVLLPSMPRLKLEKILSSLTASLPAENLIVATPETLPPDSIPRIQIC